MARSRRLDIGPNAPSKIKGEVKVRSSRYSKNGPCELVLEVEFQIDGGVATQRRHRKEPGVPIRIDDSAVHPPVRTSPAHEARYRIADEHAGATTRRYLPDALLGDVAQVFGVGRPENEFGLRLRGNLAGLELVQLAYVERFPLRIRNGMPRGRNDRPVRQSARVHRARDGEFA